VAEHGTGELSSYDTRLRRAPAELEIVSFRHHGSDSDPVQPENVVIDGSPWTNEGRMDSVRALKLIEPHLHDDRAIFGNRGHAVPAHIAAEGMKDSLSLIEPTSLELVLNDERKPRTRFVHAGRVWDLPLRKRQETT
jgi:hypothetical protein